MAGNGVLERWKTVVEELLSAAGAPGRLPADVRNHLFDLQQGIQWDSFKEGGNIDPADARLRIVLDALEALSVSELDEPSHAWNRGHLLVRAGRHLEAANDFLVAARRFESDADRGGGLTGDEADWAQSAYHHAAKNLLLGGHSASAVALLPRLSPDERVEIESLIQRSLAAS